MGKGLVDLQGSFVWTREEAVNCEVCPPGRASLKEKTTRVCRACEAGFFQPPGTMFRGRLEPGSQSRAGKRDETGGICL